MWTGRSCRQRIAPRSRMWMCKHVWPRERPADTTAVSGDGIGMGPGMSRTPGRVVRSVTVCVTVPFRAVCGVGFRLVDRVLYILSVEVFHTFTEVTDSTVRDLAVARRELEDEYSGDSLYFDDVGICVTRTAGPETAVQVRSTHAVARTDDHACHQSSSSSSLAQSRPVSSLSQGCACVWLKSAR